MITLNTIRVFNDSGGEIPAGAIAKIVIGSYDTAGRYFKIDKPDLNNMDWCELVSLQEELATGKIGLGHTNNIMIALSKPGDLLINGDKVGTEANQWWLQKIADDAFANNEGHFIVIQGLTVPDDWATDTYYGLGGRVKIEDTRYTCKQSHTSDTGEPWVNKPGVGSSWTDYWELAESEEIIVRQRVNSRFLGVYG